MIVKTPGSQIVSPAAASDGEGSFLFSYVFLKIYLRRYGQKSQPFVDVIKWHIVKDQERTVLSVTKEPFVELNSNVQKLRNSQKSAKIPRKGQKL